MRSTFSLSKRNCRSRLFVMRSCAFIISRRPVVVAEVRPAVEQAHVFACTAQPDRPLQLLQRDAAPIKVLGHPFIGRREIASDARRCQQDALNFADVVLRFFLAGLFFVRPVSGEQATLAAFMVAKFPSISRSVKILRTACTRPARPFRSGALD